jgi:hypothetical protein
MTESKVSLEEKCQRLILWGALAPVILYVVSIFVMLGAMGISSWAMPGAVIWIAAQVGNLIVIIWGLLKREMVDQQPMGFRRGFYFLYALNMLTLLGFWTFILGYT